MSTYQVGDTVRVRVDATSSSGSPDFVAGMYRYRGTFVTITKTFISVVNGLQRYRIHEDKGNYNWCNEFFEPAIDPLKEPYEYW